MGIDNVFDPDEPYGAYRYYVQPRSEMSIEEPSYTRGVYKDDESRSRSSDYVIGGGFKRGSACRIILCIFLVMSFIGVVLAAITLAVILSQHNVTRRWPSPIEFDSEMTLNGANFTYKLRDNTSEEFKALEKSVCSALHALFIADDSPIKSEWSGCEVLEFSNGSVVTRFRIFVRPSEKADTEGKRSMEEKLISYLTKKLNDDGPWKQLKINLDSIKDFVKVDKTGAMTVKPYINITTPTSRTTTTTTSTTTSTIAKAVITTKEIVNTSPNVLITSEGIEHTPTDASTQDSILTKRTTDVSMKSVTTVGVRTEALGVSSAATTSTLTGDYVGEFSTVTTERQTTKASQVIPTTGRATSAVFTKGLSEVISTGIVLNMTNATTKMTTTFTTERTSTTLSTTPSPLRVVVSTDTRTFVSTLTTPIPKVDTAEKSNIKTFSDGTRKLVTARTEDNKTSFDETVTSEGAMAFDNISTQQEITTSKLLSTSSSSSENETEIATALDLINTSTPMILVSNVEHLEISTTAFADVVSTLSTDLGLVSKKNDMITSSSETSPPLEDRTLLLETALSSTALPTDAIVINKGSTLPHSALFLTTLSPELSSITDLEPNISTITEIAMTSQSSGSTDSTKVPVHTSTDIFPSELPSVIDRTMVSSDVTVSTYTNLNVSEAIGLETFTAVSATHPIMEFTTLALKVSTDATNTNTYVPSAPAEVSAYTTLVDTLSNVSDLIMANTSLELFTTFGRTTSFVGTTISSNLTATTDVDITSPSVDNSTTEMQAASSKTFISSESVQVSSVTEVIVTESTQQEHLSQQPDNVTLGIDQKPTTVPSNETSDKPEINITLAVLSSTEMVLVDTTTAEPVTSSTHSLDITLSPFAATDAVKMEVTTSGIASTMELSPTISKIPSITTSEVTRKTEVSEVDRPTITSTAEYNYTSIDGNLSHLSSGPIYNETTDSHLAGKEIVSNISADSTDQNLTVAQFQNTTERIATSPVSHLARQTTGIITIETKNSTMGTSPNDSSRTSADQGLVETISSIDGNLSNVTSEPAYNKTTDSPSAGKEIVSNISSEITDQNVTVPQVQSTTERMATTSVSHSARQTTEIITTETINSLFSTSKSNSALTSTDQGLVDGISFADEHFNVSSEPVYNETTELISNIFAETTDQNVSIPQVQTTTESMAASIVSHSSRQATRITTTETISSVFGTPQTSTDQSLVDGISSVDANFNVSSGTVYNETTDSLSAGKEIVSNISAEIADQNMTVAQLQTTTEGIAASTVSHSARQTTTIITTETVNSVFVTSHSNSSRPSIDEGLVDGISPVDENFNVSSGPMNNETTDSPLTGKEIVSNISAAIANQNVNGPRLLTTTERIATPLVSHSERQTTEIIPTGTNTSTIGTSQSNSSRTSNDQGLVDGVSSASAIEETSLSGLTESGSQQPPAVASVNELNDTAITTVEIINFTTEPQPLVSENVSDRHPFSNNRNNSALNTSIDIFNSSEVTLPISNDTTPLTKGARNATVTGVTTENPADTDASNVTVLSLVSDSVNISTLASESITTNNLWEMTTVATNSIAMDNQTETVLANDTTNTVNVTENITDTNLTGILANTTENSLYNETVNGNVTETTPYILNFTNKYEKETESGTLNVELRDNGTSPTSWNTSDNLANTNGVTLDIVTMNDTINSTDASNVTFPSLSPVENSTLSTFANESAGNDTLVSSTNKGSGDVRIGSTLTNTNVTSTPKSNITESEPLI